MSNCYKENYFSKKCFDCDNKMICRDKVYDDLLKQFEEKDSLVEEPPTYVNDRNISLEQSEKRRLFSSRETFDIVIGKKEKEQ